MLDRASLRKLSQHPERNDPMLNVALAEEGDITVLSALADCPGVAADALAKIAGRVAVEGETVGHDPEPEPEDLRRRGAKRASDVEPEIANGTTLDAKLIIHARADDGVRDTVLARHPGDPFFALAAAAHPFATRRALEVLVRWPSKTPLHDRPWLALIDARAVPPLIIAEWSTDEDALAREGAARVTRSEAVLSALAVDPSRRVRRAVASNPFASMIHAELTEHDSACEVRARAASSIDTRKEEDVARHSGVDVTSARFAAAALSMRVGGKLAADVVRALSVGPLDEEGARLAAYALDESSVAAIVASRAYDREVDLALAAGVAFRVDMAEADDDDADDAREEDTGGELLVRCVHALAGADRTGGVLTGKGRLASWLADGVARAADLAEDELCAALGEASLAADRMVLGRVAVRARERGTEHIRSWADKTLASDGQAPIALLELAWRDAGILDETIASMSLRTRPPRKLDALPEHEVDLDPRARPLELLERVGAALVGKAPLSPRASLALVALEPRRVRYVLSALPQWKGVLAGVNVARVLRAHAGALSAAGPSGSRRTTTAAATWTQRRLDEVELAVALAIGDLAPTEAVTRLSTGYAVLSLGTALAAGMEARAALDGVGALEPLIEWLSRARSQDGAALAAWLVVEGLERVRSAAGIAAALDAPWAAPRASSGAPARGAVATGLAEALATLERRSPGRLIDVMPQTARGRAALVSGIARAYRALGGMSVAKP